MRTIISLMLVLLALGTSVPIASAQSAPENGEQALAEGASHEDGLAEEEHGLPSAAQDLFAIGPLHISNSMVVTWVVAIGLIIFAQYSTRRMQAVPSGAQNFLEWLVEGLLDFLSGVMGAALARKTFWFLATIFIFILACNWFGLIPGVGTIGWGEPKETSGFFLEHVSRPLLRGGNADLNMPLAMAMLFFLFWTIWAFQVNGPKGVFLHIFGLKGDVTGGIRYFMIVVFFAVGFIEILSIFFRPIALTFRLYGNMFAGENLLEAMANVVQHPAWAKAVFSALLPVPFYFMEVLVGIVQALVFMLLCAVFTAVMCTHEEESENSHH